MDKSRAERNIFAATYKTTEEEEEVEEVEEVEGEGEER